MTPVRPKAYTTAIFRQSNAFRPMKCNEEGLKAPDSFVALDDETRMTLQPWLELIGLKP